MFRCYYCKNSSASFEDIVNHLIQLHSEKEVKFRKCMGSSLTTINFKIVPDMCREQGRIMTIDTERNKIHISKSNVLPKDSPLKKQSKLTSIPELEPEESISYGLEESSDSDSIINELVSLLPGVIDTLQKCGKLEEYMAFNHLLNTKQFPVNNIAFLLFLDVVRWLNLDNSTNMMRYSEEVKLFWKTGLRLFHGRFLRFMSGPKNRGQVITEEATPGNFEAKSSLINFAVPDRRVLHDEEKIILDNKPGIFESMIEVVSRADSDQKRTYKICVDGKKLNPSSSGEVDLWGFEKSPTFEEKRTRLNEETQCLEEVLSKLTRFESFGHSHISDLNASEQNSLADSLKLIILIVANRLKDLRHLKMNKELALNKLQGKFEGDWKSSPYAMVISSIRTAIIKTEMCIDGFLECSNNLCHHTAYTGNTAEYIRTSTQVNLQNQGNVVCLTNNTEGDILDSSLVKQKSEAWFKIRNTSLVTGSTIHTAVGLNGLKRQREFMEIASGSREPQPISDDLQQKFDHGTSNEVNAVATFVSTVLPSFCPDGKFFEEGCYVTKENEKPILVVSPDGSIRDTDNQSRVLYGIEIKCPMPGKTHSTPVHYSIPKYYIPQILSEMFALQTDILFFLSYSKESMTVLEAGFDEDLWNNILGEIRSLDGMKNQRKTKASTTTIKDQIEKYRTEKVKLIAEVQSKLAKTCDHSISSSTRNFHDNVTDENMCDSQSVREVQKTLLRCTELLNNSHMLCAQRASEVLVFLLSDLDRVYKPETLHAYPIAYALRGYSVSSESMRKLIQEVLNTLMVKGLYTPVVSFDGEWAPVAFKTERGRPLTLLELQRHVYDEVKKTSKQDIVRTITETAVVKVDSFDNVLQQVDYRKTETGAVEVGVRVGVKLYRTSAHTKNILAAKLQKRCESQTVLDELQTNIDDIFSSVPADVMQNLDDEIIESVTKLNSLDNNSVHSSGYSPTFIESVGELGNFLSDNDSTDACRANVTDSVDVQNVGELGKNVSANVSTDSCYANITDSVDDSHESDVTPSATLDKDDVRTMFRTLQSNNSVSGKWINKSLDQFEHLVQNPIEAKAEMTKKELIVCLDAVQMKLSNSNLRFGKSWNKDQLTKFISMAVTSKPEPVIPKRKKKTFTPNRLAALCKRKIHGLPKSTLNAVMAEHMFLDEYQIWTESSPFDPTTMLAGLGKITWFSMPDYNESTLSHIFTFLDVHHLITNCRIKVCKDGFPERNVNKQAWIAVARENQTKLKISHVEDLVDKQSDSIAKETFSNAVGEAMDRLGFREESHFCTLIREFYEAEDDPGITALERCRRRLNLREWLLQGVNFSCFPPFGMYIRGIPHVMFQGFLTNIERRMQLFPYVKSGAYNVRTLGSLEVENLFGAFQDLDPKGSGVIKAQDIPSALETSCQLHKTRLLPNRPFYMTLSEAKVYPVHELMEQDNQANDNLFVYPQHTSVITLRDHGFDSKARAKRKAQRKLVGIAGTEQAARGVAPIRQYHRCDESKIMAHKRAGIDIE